ncbi:MAG: YceI family protein [Candidatus Kapabacteria bacterium]|nr:YceI family protein [Candidatus Kapabacteria bacterium]MDW8224889.1 YceI family protein [Bacteroidota bacterium]
MFWLVSAGMIVYSAVAQQVQLHSASTLWIEGNSTLHAWSAKATQLNVTGNASAVGSVLRWKIDSLLLRIPVRGLSSGKRDLDENMWTDLKAARYPEILFRLKNYRPQEDVASDSLPISVEGWLTVAGRERLISFPAMWSVTGNRIRVRGSTELLMTDFGIKPRTFLVVMKVDNRVVVRFDLLFEVR